MMTYYYPEELLKTVNEIWTYAFALAYDENLMQSYPIIEDGKIVGCEGSPDVIYKMLQSIK